MRKKIAIASIISLLLIIIIILSVALVKVNANHYQPTYEEQSIANDFAAACRNEDSLRKFIDEYIDFHAWYALDNLYDAHIDQRSTPWGTYWQYYNEDSDEYRSFVNSNTNGLFTYSAMNLDLSIKEIEPLTNADFNLGFKKIQVTYNNKNGKKATFTFTYYEKVIASISATYDGVIKDKERTFYEGKYTDYYFPQENTTNESEDSSTEYAAFSFKLDTIKDIYKDYTISIKESDNNKYDIELEDDMMLFVDLNIEGKVEKLDFNYLWENKNPDTSICTKYVSMLLDNIAFEEGSLVETTVTNQLTEIKDAFNNDSSTEYPHYVYNDIEIIEHTRFHMLAIKESDSETTYHFIVTPLNY